jgi:hypothetical protein
MTSPPTIERIVHFRKEVKGRRTLHAGIKTPPRPSGKLPRVTRLLALAHRLEQYRRDGVVADYSDLARLGHVSRARISQILNLINLAPDLQEEILMLPESTDRAPLLLSHLQPIASCLLWSQQRQLWMERRKQKKQDQ